MKTQGPSVDIGEVTRNYSRREGFCYLSIYEDQYSNLRAPAEPRQVQHIEAP
jgi:hypothetical protein